MGIYGENFMKRFLSLFLSVLCIVLPLVSFSSCDIQPKQKFKAYYFDYFDTATTIVGWEKSQEDFDATCQLIKNELDFYQGGGHHALQHKKDGSPRSSGGAGSGAFPFSFH